LSFIFSNTSISSHSPCWVFASHASCHLHFMASCSSTLLVDYFQYFISHLKSLVQKFCHSITKIQTSLLGMSSFDALLPHRAR
jgi:hypothetical protein